MDDDETIRVHGASVDRLRPVSLDDVVSQADLQTRVDRKYLVPLETWTDLVAAHRSTLRALDISGRRTFRYESVYFDTPDLASYLGTVRSRPTRFKVRTRSYHDTAGCVLEVKRRNGRGETVKLRTAHPLVGRAGLTVDSLAFVAPHLSVPVDPRSLAPALATTYRRITLLEEFTGSRITCDAALQWSSPTSARTLPLPDLLVVEVKSTRSSTPIDRMLWSWGHRPVRFSKFGTGLAALRPDLPANKWNATLRRHLGWQPARSADDGRRGGSA